MASAVLNWCRRRRSQLYLSVRITTACVVTFALGHLLGLAQSYWAVFTAVIVMQGSVGGSLKAAVDRFLGSVGGASLGVLVALTIPRDSPVMMGVALAVAVAPLGLLAALKPAYRVAPVTAVILLLTPLAPAGGPLASGVSRILEIGLGSLVALLVALFVLPARAHGVLAEATSGALRLMSDLAARMLSHPEEPWDAAAVRDDHDRIRLILGRAEVAADEAKRERANYLTAAADPEPLIRTLRRLRHDLAMIGRATTTPLSGPVGAVLGEPTAQAGEAVSAFLRASAAAVAAGRDAPSFDDVEAALAGHAAAVARLRQHGMVRALPDETVGRLFSLAFGLEQLRQNLADLADRINEHAGRSRR
jgi:uncharacterized membrane protein YccC